MRVQTGEARARCGVVVRCGACAPDAAGPCGECLVTAWSEDSGGILRLDGPERQALAALFAAGLVPLAHREHPSRTLALAGA